MPRDHRVVLVGRTKREIPVPDNCVNLLNHTTILQLIWLVRRARFIISVDSGPMHIAAAITDRLISIHTWSDPRKVGPYNGDAWVWKNGQLLRARDLPRPFKTVEILYRIINNYRQNIWPQTKSNRLEYSCHFPFEPCSKWTPQKELAFRHQKRCHISHLGHL